MWWSKSPSTKTSAADDSLSPNTHPYEQTSSSSSENTPPWRWPANPAASPPHNGSPTPDDEENGGYNLSAANKTGRGTTRTAKREMICGIRRKVFFMIIFGGMLVAVAAVAIGVGAGIAFGRRKK